MCGWYATGYNVVIHMHTVPHKLTNLFKLTRKNNLDNISESAAKFSSCSQQLNMFKYRYVILCETAHPHRTDLSEIGIIL